MNKFFRAAGLIAAAVLTVGANSNWNTNVVASDRVHTIGNPKAEVTLIEFISYTCPHCATFAKEGEAPLQMVYIGQGKVKLEVRSVIRNVVDLTATMLTQCGDTKKFLQNHTMFMAQQDEWLTKARNSTPAQQALWVGPDGRNARQSMATALGFYDMMETRGYSRPDLDRCLADQTRADQLVANTNADYKEYGITGTPSFVLNGELLADVHSWGALYPKLDANF